MAINSFNSVSIDAFTELICLSTLGKNCAKYSATFLIKFDDFFNEFSNIVAMELIISIRYRKFAQLEVEIKLIATSRRDS